MMRNKPENLALSQKAAKTWIRYKKRELRLKLKEAPIYTKNYKSFCNTKNAAVLLERNDEGYDETFEREDIFVVPCYLPIIDSVREELDKLFPLLQVDHILEAFEREGRVTYDDPLFPQVDLMEQMPADKMETFQLQLYEEIRAEIIAKIRQIIALNVPVFTDSTVSKLIAVKTQDGLEGGATFYRLNNCNSSIISIEGPQGSGKSTQASNLRTYFHSQNIPLLENLPPQNDPAKSISDYESANGVLMPFSERQRFARASLSSRYNYVRNRTAVAILDRSPFSAFSLHATISRVQKVDGQECLRDSVKLRTWWDAIASYYGSEIFVLMNNDIISSYFRMKKDPDIGNQKVDFVSQILEHIFYRNVVKLGYAREIDITGKNPEEVFNNLKFHICLD